MKGANAHMELLSSFERSEKVKVSCIYKITNKINGKVYIGQTTNFRKRCSDYMNIHKRANTRLYIGQMIIKYGTENFTIEIEKVCKPDELTKYEMYYINKYKSSEADFGYNITKNIGAGQNNEESRRRKSDAHTGIKESSDTKRHKSNLILAIKDDTIIVCDSGKLFGDFIGKSKDYIKNCLRQPSSISGYRLYYDDYLKRQDIRKKMMKKRCIRDLQYMIYLDILDRVEVEGVETITQYFKTIKMLRYVDNDDGYEFIDYVIEAPKELEPQPIDLIERSSNEIQEHAIK